MVNNSKKETREQIEDFFRKEKFESREVKKIKKLARRYNLKLGVHRKSFCKKCLSQLKGKTRVSKEYKRVECEKCGQINKFKL